MDALIILRSGAGVTPHPQCKSHTDLNGDSQSNAVDAALVLQVDASLVSYGKSAGVLAHDMKSGCVTIRTFEAGSMQLTGAIPEPPPAGYFLHVWGFVVAPDKGCADQALRVFFSTYLAYV
jgi:hypothetical protein